MIELKDDKLRFTFPEVHRDAAMSIEFQRTLRIPDDDRTHSLPPGLGRFPVRHVDDFAEKVPPAWLEHGGVMLPMFQSEALWLNFGGAYLGSDFSGGTYLKNAYLGGGHYPCAVKIATGKVNAVTGEAWRNKLSKRPQDYVEVPKQRWLDGYCVKKGVIRQFVAMPLGSGYSAEEQITGAAEHGGIQIVVYPMKAKVYRRLMKEPRRSRRGGRDVYSDSPVPHVMQCNTDMGLAPGGRMKQQIHKDPHGIKVWDTEHASRCFVHIANSLVWSSITGAEPPHPPPTAEAYTDAGLPWFDYYDDSEALKGAAKLEDMESVATRGERKGENPLPENEPVTPENVVKLRSSLKEGQVREWSGTS